jgi:hypothetical protein
MYFIQFDSYNDIMLNIPESSRFTIKCITWVIIISVLGIHENFKFCTMVQLFLNT